MKDKYGKDLDALLSKGDCASKLGAYAQTLKDIIANKTTVITFDPNSKDAKRIVPETGQTLGQFFAECPACASTRAFWTQRPGHEKKYTSYQITLGPEFFSASAERQTSLFIHESLHTLFPTDTNADLVTRFNISIPGESAEKAITTWLENGCKDKKDD